MIAKSAGNRPYVQSGPDGAFYARCIPESTEGKSGSTTIYQVVKEKDKLVASYNWFAKNGVVIGWSPIKGKVTTLAIQLDTNKVQAKQQELTMYLGEKLVKTVTTKDLLKLGAQIQTRRSANGPLNRAKFKVLGCFQVPGTNQYVYKVQLSKNRIISFDIVDGAIVSE